MLRRALLLGLLVVALLGMPSPASANDAGTIMGQVVNGTGEGGLVAYQPLTLKTYLDAEEIDSAAAETDDQGRFEFGGLDTEAGYLYQVSLEYQEAQYESDWIDFSDGETTKSITITVYESTADDVAIMIMASHTIIYPQENSLYVREYYLFVNDSDRTYIGSDGTTLRLGLPPGATYIGSDRGLMDCCISIGPEGVTDTMAVIPGGKEIVFSYTVPATSASLNLSKAMLYPLINYDLLLASEFGVISSPQLTAGEDLNIEGTVYRHFFAQNLIPGTVLDVRLSGLGGGGGGQDTWLWTLLGSLVLLAGLTFGYVMRRRYGVITSGPADSSAARRRLLLRLAQLDDNFEAGRLPEEEYRQLRSGIKAQLQQLWPGSGEGWG